MLIASSGEILEDDGSVTCTVGPQTGPGRIHVPSVGAGADQPLH